MKTNDSIFTYEDWKQEKKEYKEFLLATKEVLSKLRKLKRDGITTSADVEYIMRVINIAEQASRLQSLLQDAHKYIMFEKKPTPFDKVKIPPFPIDSLPKVVADFVKAVALSTQTSLEMSGALSLGVLATAMQGKGVVEIKADYIEQLSLFMAAIAETGERKSAVIKHSTTPLNEYERNYNDLIAPDVEMNKIEKRILTGEINKLENKLIKCGYDEKIKAELDEKVNELADFQELNFLRLLVSDASPEKLIDIMDKQNGRISICSAEGTLFDLISAKNDRGTTIIESLLKGYSGDFLAVDRITREGNYIEKPHISTILSIQPYVVDKFMGNTEYSSRGLISRFLFVLCNSFIGVRESTSPDIPDETKNKYKELIFNLLNIPTERIFKLSYFAEKERQKLYDIVEKRLVNEWHFMRDFGAKFVGTTIRIAGLIHSAEYGSGKFYQSRISRGTFKRAVKMAEYFGKQAEAIYLRGGENENVEKAKYILARLKTAMKYEFTKGEMLNLCGKYKADELSAGIKLLEDHEYIVIEKTESGSKGRPSEMVYLNPEIDLLK